MQQSNQEKRWAYWQAYSGSEVLLSRETGEYPNRDYAGDRAALLRGTKWEKLI